MVLVNYDGNDLKGMCFRHSSGKQRVKWTMEMKEEKMRINR